MPSCRVFSLFKQAIIRRFDEESYWVVAEICSYHAKQKDQVAMLIKFIEVAELCLEKRNFFSFFSIMGALSFQQVHVDVFMSVHVTSDHFIEACSITSGRLL